MKNKSAQSVTLKRSTYRKLVRYARESCQTVEETIERIVTSYIDEDDELEREYQSGALSEFYLEQAAELGIPLGPQLVKTMRHDHMDQTSTIFTEPTEQPTA